MANFVDISNLSAALSANNIKMKDFVTTQIGGQSVLHAEVVVTLPTVDMSPNVLYLVPNNSGEVENIYDEYIYVNADWEKIGSRLIDLSGYSTTTQVQTMITNAQYVLPVGSTTVLGGLKVDGVTIVADANGVASAVIPSTTAYTSAEITTMINDVWA
jgi:hypothetical protein